MPYTPGWLSELLPLIKAHSPACAHADGQAATRAIQARQDMANSRARRVAAIRPAIVAAACLVAISELNLAFAVEAGCASCCAAEWMATRANAAKYTASPNREVGRPEMWRARSVAGICPAILAAAF